MKTNREEFVATDFSPLMYGLNSWFSVEYDNIKSTGKAWEASWYARDDIGFRIVCVAPAKSLQGT